MVAHDSKSDLPLVIFERGSMCKHKPVSVQAGECTELAFLSCREHCARNCLLFCRQPSKSFDNDSASYCSGSKSHSACFI